jgi:hypothetical protein
MLPGKMLPPSSEVIKMGEIKSAANEIGWSGRLGRPDIRLACQSAQKFALTV